MTYNIDRQPHISVASITSSGTEIVVAYISVDMHDTRNVTTQAIELMYADALLSGAGEYSREAFLDAIHRLGASIDCNVVDAQVTISLRATRQHFAQLLHLVEIMLTKPTFTESEMKRIRLTTSNELHESKEDSKRVAYEQLCNNLYGTHDRKYTYDPDKTSAEVRGITSKKIRKYHEKLMTRAWNCSVLANADGVQRFNRMLHTVKDNRTSAHQGLVTHTQKTQATGLLLKNIPSRQNIDFSVGAAVPFTLHHPDYVPLAFGLTVLGKYGGFTGRLMSTVREKEGLTYGIYSRLEGFTGTEQGYWRIMTFFSPEKAVQGLTSTLRELRNIHKTGITTSELKKFRTIIHTGQTLIKDSPVAMINELHTYQCHGFSLDEMAEHKARFTTVTTIEVNAAIKKYVDPSNLTVSGAGPTAVVKKDLGAFYKSVS